MIRSLIRPVVVSGYSIRLLERGMRRGFIVKYNTATSVSISAGKFEGNGILYSLSWPEINYSSSDIEVLSGNRYELPSGHGLTFQVGQFIEVTGFTTGANNGVKEVTVFSGDQVTVAETLTPEAAGDSVTIDSHDFVHPMTSLASGFDWHYVMIDHSASYLTPDSPVFYDTTTEPIYNLEKKGRYIGDDVCIWGKPSTDGAATLITSVASYRPSERTWCDEYPRQRIKLAENMNPTGSWQTPNLMDMDVATPVMAKEVGVQVYALDVGGGDSASVYMTTKEMGDIETSTSNGVFVIQGNERAVEPAILVLGESRKIYCTGEDDDDNNLGVDLIRVIGEA